MLRYSFERVSASWWLVESVNGLGAASASTDTFVPVEPLGLSTLTVRTSVCAPAPRLSNTAGSW